MLEDLAKKQPISPDKQRSIALSKHDALGYFMACSNACIPPDKVENSDLYDQGQIAYEQQQREDEILSEENIKRTLGVNTKNHSRDAIQTKENKVTQGQYVNIKPKLTLEGELYYLEAFIKNIKKLKQEEAENRSGSYTKKRYRKNNLITTKKRDLITDYLGVYKLPGNKEGETISIDQCSNKQIDRYLRVSLVFAQMRIDELKIQVNNYKN